jgi:uncharacterized protein YlaN (UPF0358 family)
VGQKQLQAIIDQCLERLEQRRLRDTIAQASRAILWVKSFISQAVQASSEASIAWDAVSLILPLLTNPATAAEANRDGFSYVTTRTRYYAAFETEILRLGQSRGEQIEEVTVQIVDLYEDILDFQLRSVLRFYQNSVRVLLRDVVLYDDWSEKVKKIKEMEDVIFRELTQTNDFASRTELEDLRKAGEESLLMMQKALPVLEEQL